MTDDILVVDDVSVQFGGIQAVSNVSFTINSGSITGVIGPNGAGKSTLLGVISGKVHPISGVVRHRTQDLTKSPIDARCRRGICATHQNPRPFLELTVRDNLEVGQFFGSSGRASMVEWALDTCELSQHENTLASTLRPSELRRLELARALATAPEVLLVDEVAAGMPHDEIPQLTETLLGIREKGITLLIVEHVMHALLPVAERLLVLDNGRILADGPPDEVIRRQDVVDAYFGEDWEK